MRRAQTQLHHLARRQMSIAVPASSAHFGSVAASLAVDETPETKTERKSLSVEQYSQLAYQPYIVRGESTQSLAYVRINEEQAQLGDEIRSLLSARDVEGLYNLMTRVRLSRDWDVVTKGLTRPEISLLIRVLVGGQLEMLKLLKNLSSVISGPEYKTMLKRIDSARFNLSTFYHKLIRQNFQFTTSELESLLEFEAKNYQYPTASKLIQYISTNKLCTSSVLYHNLRFRILADTDPTTWKTNNNKPLVASAYRGTLKTTVAFSQLLLQLSKQTASSQFIPNLQSHREILAGFGKTGDLDQVRDHILAIWGVSHVEDGETLDSTSALYPDVSVLEVIINVFGMHQRCDEALEYLKMFTERYDVDVQRDPLVWSVMTRMIELQCGEDVQSASRLFGKMWGLMTQLDVRFFSAVYNKRFEVLSKNGEFEVLDGDLKLLFDKCVQSDAVQKLRVQKVLTKYIIGISENFYRALPEKSASKIVKRYFKKYSVDREHYATLLVAEKKIVASVKTEKDQFEAMQRQYDEEDDEGSLW